MKYYIRITLFALLLLPVMSKAGWVITGRYIDRDGKTIFKRYFIQNNDVKVEQFNLIYSINLKTESIILVDPENLVFVRTNLKAYQQKVKEARLTRLSELLELIPADQKSEIEKKYRAQAEREIFLPEYDQDSLIIRQLADTVKLLGKHTAKFMVFENGLKKEDFFFTDEIDISSDFDLDNFLKYQYVLEPSDKTIRYRSSGKYLDIVKKGLVLRRFIYEDGYRTEWQVNKYEHKDIPAYEFGTPDLCKELTLEKWLSRQKNSEDKYYDDYE